MSTETRPSLHPVVRVVIGAAVTAGALWGALVAWFVGIVSWTGCFISCGDPNRLAGAGLVFLAGAFVGVAAVAVDFAIRGWARHRAVRVWAVAAVIGAILGALTLVYS